MFQFLSVNPVCPQSLFRGTHRISLVSLGLVQNLDPLHHQPLRLKVHVMTTFRHLPSPERLQAEMQAKTEALKSVLIEVLLIAFGACILTNQTGNTVVIRFNIRLFFSPVFNWAQLIS